MKKEVVLAISIGFALGLIITFGIWTANQSLKNIPQPSPKASAAPSPTPTNLLTNNQLTINTPDDESLVTTDTTTLSGTTTAGATLLIISENGEQTAIADASGNFSADVDLVTGFNIITVHSYSTDGQEFSKSLTITYSTAKMQ